MLLTLIIFVIILGVIVLVHEAGHFMAARRFGMQVDEFGLGFPPRLFGFRRGRTLFSVNSIPIGGFVKIKGEDGGGATDRDSFSSRAPWQRIVVLASGVLMNILLAAVLFTVGFTVGMPSVVEDHPTAGMVRQEKIQIVDVAEGGPAAAADIQPGDTLSALDHQPMRTISEIEDYNRPRLNQEVTVTLLRDGQTIDVPLTLRTIDDTGAGKMGVTLVRTGIVSYPWYEALGRGILQTFQALWAIIVAFALLIRNLFIGQSVGGDVTGPIGIAVLTGQVAKLGILYLLQFTALLSLNLAIINFIPFPALDGGRVLFVVLEKIRGKAVNRDIENFIHNIGFSLLLLLIALITWRDISHYGGSIYGIVKNIFT